MILRIVKLTIEEKHLEDFLSIFQNSQQIILSQEGCSHVQLYQDISEPNICFTYSLWKDTKSLNKYRKSKDFGRIWPKTKKLFSKKAEAWSLVNHTN